MDKKLLAYCCIVAVMIIGVIVFVSLFFNLQDYKFKGRLAPLQSAKVVTSLDHGVQYAPEMRLIAGICALLLVGYLFWAFYKKVQKCSQADQTARERSLYNISLATGRTEFSTCDADTVLSGNSSGSDSERPPIGRRNARSRSRTCRWCGHQQNRTCYL